MDIQASLCLASIVTAVIYVLYHTEALVEYGKLFRLNRLLKLEEYFCFKLSNGTGVNYFDFLKTRNNNFITRLMSCPYCFGFWCCLAVSLGRQNPLAVYGFYLLMYKILIYGKSA
jgi:hypothetical protein